MNYENLCKTKTDKLDYDIITVTMIQTTLSINTPVNVVHYKLYLCYTTTASLFCLKFYQTDRDQVPTIWKTRQIDCALHTLCSKHLHTLLNKKCSISISNLLQQKNIWNSRILNTIYLWLFWCSTFSPNPEYSIHNTSDHSTNTSRVIHFIQYIFSAAVYSLLGFSYAFSSSFSTQVDYTWICSFWLELQGNKNIICAFISSFKVYVHCF